MLPRIRTTRSIKSAIKDVPDLSLFAFDVFAVAKYRRTLLDLFEYSYSGGDDFLQRWAFRVHDLENNRPRNSCMLICLQILGLGLNSPSSQNRVEDLRALASKSPTHASRALLWCFNMKIEITRPGYSTKHSNSNASHVFQKAAISGFGNVRTQETEFNPDIRSAREIPVQGQPRTGH